MLGFSVTFLLKKKSNQKKTIRKELVISVRSTGKFAFDFVKLQTLQPKELPKGNIYKGLCARIESAQTCAFSSGDK